MEHRSRQGVAFVSCKHLDGQECVLGLHGGRPSPGVCARCSSYEGPSRGLGDVVAKVARVTGVAAVVKRVAGEDCGCAGRRAALNRAVPFREGAD
jgi:hypothetical protein